MPEDEKTLEERLNALKLREAELVKKTNAIEKDRIEFLQNQLLSLGKDDATLIHAITNADSLESIIKKRNQEIEKEKETKANQEKTEVPKVAFMKANGGLPSVVLPDGTNTKIDPNKTEQAQGFSGIHFNDPLAVTKFNSHKEGARPALLDDPDYPVPRMVG